MLQRPPWHANDFDLRGNLFQFMMGIQSLLCGECLVVNVFSK
jgi:hypothetical protein